MLEQLPAGCDLARLSAYRDGELEVAERQQVAAHLQACRECQRALADYALLASTLHRPVAGPPAAAMRVDLGARLVEPGPGVRSGWAGRLLPGLAMAMAAVAAMAVASPGTLPLGQRLGSGQFVAAPGLVPARTPSAYPAAAPPLQRASGAQASTCARPLPSVALVFAHRPEVQSGLGCATDAARVLGLVSQAFERGNLLRRGDTDEVYAVGQAGRWLHDLDPGPNAQPVIFTPGDEHNVGASRWFSRVWLARPDMHALLGQAVSGHQQFQALVQTYERGVALWDGRGLVYVLMENGESLRYLDQRASQGDADEPVQPPALQA